MIAFVCGLGEVHYPARAFEPIRCSVKCAKCGRGKYAAFDGLAYHSYYLPAKFLRREREP